MLGRDCAEFARAARPACASAPTSPRLAAADVLIDFTRPQATLAHLDACSRLGVRLVIGTTGFDEAGKHAIHAAAERIAIVFAPNMSVGVNVTFKLLEIAARMLTEGYDIEIIEAHHRHKVDAPIGHGAQDGRDRRRRARTAARRSSRSTRAKATPASADRRSIGFAAIRGGDIVGDHTVLFAGTGERIEITHRSASRQPYANGQPARGTLRCQHSRRACSTCSTCSALAR